jgi:hypothetical protein
MAQKIIQFDFDGVIHSYTSGWKGITNIPDPPVEGIQEAIEEIRNAGYSVVIVSSRCSTEEGIQAIKQWLDKYNIVVDNVCKEKQPALLNIDDRTICFDGKAKDLLSKIQNFRTWQNRRQK